jgi:hypothetical protein
VGFGRDGPTVTHLLFADDSVVFLEASASNLEALKGILQQYEACSGQRVNLHKSSIYFGKGTTATVKTLLKNKVGIQCEALSERYLGLPTVVGRSKNGDFKHLSDRSRGKVAGLKGQGLSKTGKEILVKSVLQAVPTYTMGCFQLTKGQCNTLKSISADFWWGDLKGKRSVHWLSWEKMCASKRSGGMGFRDYHDFNQALLAKQAWRPVSAPDSLCARVLRARYFKDGKFLSAGCPKRASYTWRSIVHGKELLKEGLIWRVGNGNNIEVWNQNWIPRSSLKRPMGIKPDKHVEKVDELLLPDGGGWNIDKLNEVF